MSSLEILQSELERKSDPVAPNFFIEIFMNFIDPISVCWITVRSVDFS